MFTFGKRAWLGGVAGLVAIALLLPVSGEGADGSSELKWTEDQEKILATVEAYHHALTSQDSVSARNLLADDTLVLEGGHTETLEEYLGHHLGADMQFASQVAAERTVLQVVVEGDVGWVSSSSKMEGEFRGREIQATGAELMVLSRREKGWKIRAIHWSSR